MNKNEGEIIIRIVETNEGAGGGGGTDKPKKEKKEKRPSKKKSVKENNDVSTALTTSVIQHAAKRLLSIGINEVNYQIDKYLMLHDNYIAQQTKAHAEVLSSTVDTIAKSIAGGFMTGGPIGALIMAGVEGAHLEQKIRIAREKEEMKIKEIENQLQFNRQRAGFSLTAGPTGENR